MRYIALLRGVNVGGKNKLPMAAFRTQLEAKGFESVASYIQSGNIGLNSGLEAKQIKYLIEQLLQEEYQYKVPVLILPQRVLHSLVKAHPHTNLETDIKYLHFTLLHTNPSKAHRKYFDDLEIAGEEFLCGDSCVFLHLPNGYGRAKLTNGFIERQLKVSATTRNYKTIQKLVDL